MKDRDKKNSLKQKLKKIRLFAMDVDGVLTEGSIILLESGEEIKFWSVRDRIGFYMLRLARKRFYTAWITGRKSRQVAQRAKEIKLDSLRQDCMSKGAALREIRVSLGLKKDEVLFIGDDLVDLSAFKEAGLAVCPSDAVDLIKRRSHYVTRAAGGRGVLRDMVDGVLQAQGLWKGVVNRFENPR